MLKLQNSKQNLRSIRRMKIKIVSIIIWIMFLTFLVRMFVAYPSLPSEIGVHFSKDGSFDVIASKRFAWYPYVVSGIVLLLGGLFDFLIGKIKVGFRVTQVGEEQIKNVVRVFLIAIKTGTVIFFSGIWADCVIRQRNLNTTLAGVISFIYLFAIVAFLIAVVAVRAKNGRKE